MSELQESVLQIFNGCLEFLIGLFFVDFPDLRVVGGLCREMIYAGEKRNYGELWSIEGMVIFQCLSLFPSDDIWRQE